MTNMAKFLLSDEAKSLLLGEWPIRRCHRGFNERTVGELVTLYMAQKMTIEATGENVWCLTLRGYAERAKNGVVAYS